MLKQSASRIRSSLVSREVYHVGDKSVWIMAYSWQQRHPSLFWTIRYWLYAICSFLRTRDERRARCAVPGGVERRALPPRRRFVYEFPLRELTPSAERRSVRGGIPNPARRDCGHRHAVCFASAPGDATRYDPCPFSRTVSLANRPSSVRSPFHPIL